MRAFFLSGLVLPLGVLAAEPPRAPEVLVAAICATCHGPTLTGGSGPNLLDDRWNHGADDAGLLTSIRDGWPATGMPGFREALTSDEQRALVAYLRQQGGEYAAGRIQAPPPPPAEPIESELHTFRVETWVDGLELPWGMAFLPDGRMLVTERPGRLRVIENGVLNPTPITGLPQVHAKQDGGLLDVTVHPDFAKNGWIYLAYAEPGTVPDTSMTVVVRGRIRAGAWVDNEVLFRTAPRFYTADNSHFGCRFVWDEERRLYFSLGDRGAANDAQDVASPLGKIHRIHDDGRVPADNPFVGKPGAVATIWSLGHRNPQGLRFHPVTGKLWATEHGPIGGDELNRIEPGQNYGWPIVSRGTDIGRTFLEKRADFVAPLATWTPPIAPSGILFYTGERFPRWKNSLLIASLIGQQLRRVEVEGDRVVRQEVLFKGHGRVRAITMGPDGLLYVAFTSTPGGRIARIVPLDEGQPVAVRPPVKRGIFGRTPDGVEVESYTLTNRRGASAKVITMGATLAELRVPDRAGVVSGVVQEIVPSAKGFEEGFANSGAVIGRVANRIAGAKFMLDGREVRITANRPPHHIHGGTKGFKRVVWRAEVPDGERTPSVRLTYVSVDGEEGYPGTLTVAVTYTLTEDNTLRLDYAATTDAPTPVNLTNHAYFNLGSGGDVIDYAVEIAADQITAAVRGFPTGEFKAVAGTPFDFTQPRRLGDRAEQLGQRPIYDDNYVLRREPGDTALRFAARVADAASGRQMEVWTTEPGMQLFTSTLSVRPVVARVGYICLETQHFPDAVNQPHFPSTILRPGTVFRSTTEYRFSTR